MNLAQFVRSHGAPYDPKTDDYRVPPFRRNLHVRKATAVYGMHSYHQGKKPHDAIRAYIRHFTQPGDLVLDPFCGSGGTALASILEGRMPIGLDRSPAAEFIARNYCTPADPSELEPALAEIVRSVQPEIDWLYETRCDRCGGKARTISTVFSERFRCPGCGRAVVLFDCALECSEPHRTPEVPKKSALCPHCRHPISTRGERLGSLPVLVEYRCPGGCEPAVAQRRHNDPGGHKRRFFKRYDLGKIREIERLDIPYWYPTAVFPQSFARWQRDLRLAQIDTVADLYTKRNLWALAAIRAKAVANPCADQALFALTAISLAVSRMQRYSPRSGFPNMLLVGTYYVPPIGREIEVGSWYEGKLRNLLRGYAAISRSDFQSLPEGPRAPRSDLKSLPERPIGNRPYFVAMADARSLAIPSNTIDYIFTDPPYADAVQYGELNFVWESWLGLTTDWHAEEIVVSPSRGKTEADWAADLRRAVRECYRVLKPGRWLSLCYHDTSERRWAVIQDIFAEAGFVLDADDSAACIETDRKSFNQFMLDKTTKRDLVISFRKPRAGQRRPVPAAQSDPAAFEELGRQIIREFLTAHPGSTKDRIYDELISRLICRGQMKAHDFETLLRSVAKPRRRASNVRWYLKMPSRARKAP